MKFFLAPRKFVENFLAPLNLVVIFLAPINRVDFDHFRGVYPYYPLHALLFGYSSLNITYDHHFNCLLTPNSQMKKIFFSRPPLKLVENFLAPP